MSPRRVRLAGFLVSSLCLAAMPAARSGGRAAAEASTGSFMPIPAAGSTEGVLADAAGLSPSVLDLALDATACAARRGVVKAPPTLTVIDYSRPSTEPRLWVIDLRTRDVLYRELVAHGKNTGGNMATRFSNEIGSLQSSLGLFVTEDTYLGSNGYSLRLNGLEPGVNDRARARAIVVHGAAYVDARSAAALGRLGRSWGCPALRAPIAREVIDRVKGGGLLFAYYPDQHWLNTSAFLHDCGEP